jgi:ubiquitin-conjugating enzyme E2 G1
MAQALRYVMAQYRHYVKDPLDGFFCSPCEDPFKWEFTLIGIHNTPFEGNLIYGYILFPHTFPNDPPSIHFTSKMYHPNIGTDGKLCMSTLHDQRSDNFYDKADEKWNPVNTIQSIILSMMLIIQEPNLESPANIDAAKDLRENKINYLRKVRNYLK